MRVQCGIQLQRGRTTWQHAPTMSTRVSIIVVCSPARLSALTQQPAASAAARRGVSAPALDTTYTQAQPQTHWQQPLRASRAKVLHLPAERHRGDHRIRGRCLRGVKDAHQLQSVRQAGRAACSAPHTMRAHGGHGRLCRQEVHAVLQVQGQCPQCLCLLACQQQAALHKSRRLQWLAMPAGHCTCGHVVAAHHQDVVVHQLDVAPAEEGVARCADHKAGAGQVVVGQNVCLSAQPCVSVLVNMLQAGWGLIQAVLCQACCAISRTVKSAGQLVLLP